MHPVFYIPGESSPGIEGLVAVGLAELGLTGHCIAACPCDGPDVAAGGTGRGSFVWWPARGVTPLPEGVLAWEWSPAKPDPDRNLPAGRFWLGRDPVSPAVPADVARRHPFAGADVLLDDGQLWHVPIARALPHKLTLDEEGRRVRKVQKHYARYFDLALQFHEAICSIGSPMRRDLHVADALVLAELGLALNYRVNRDVIDWLELLADEDTLFRVACAAIELGDWIALDQKKTADPIPAISKFCPG